MEVVWLLRLFGAGTTKMCTTWSWTLGVLRAVQACFVSSSCATRTSGIVSVTNMADKPCARAWSGAAKQPSRQEDVGVWAPMGHVTGNLKVVEVTASQFGSQALFADHSSAGGKMANSHGRLALTAAF